MLMIFSYSCRSWQGDSNTSRESTASIGLNKTLPPGDSASMLNVINRNVLNISVGTDRVLCNGKAIRMEEIKPLVKRFFLNPDNDTLMSEKIEKDIEGLGLSQVSKGLVVLDNARETPYSLYIQVQNEIAAAINELRDEFSQKTFGKSFEQLSEEQSRHEKVSCCCIGSRAAIIYSLKFSARSM